MATAQIVDHKGLEHGVELNESEYEVFVASRTFTAWGGGIMQRLPHPVARLAKEVGVCHFLMVVRDKKTGALTAFDYGPQGGETTLQVSQVQDQNGKQKLGAAGEIREEVIGELPEGALLVGSTNDWDLDAIRRHNVQQPTVYRLNENDCRHYVNNLVKKICGVEAATVELLKTNFQQRMKAEKEAWVRELVGEASEQAYEDAPAAGSVSLRRRHSTSAGQLSTLASAESLIESHPRPLVRVHSATATATLGSVLHSAAPIASGVQEAQAGSKSAAVIPPSAVPLVKPLLHALPTWDTPIVALGQMLTHPHHWAALIAMSQAAALSTTVAVGARVIGLTQVAAAATASSITGSVQQASAAIQQANGAATAFRALPAVAGAARQAAAASSSASPGPLRQALGVLPRMMQNLRAHELRPPAPYSPIVSNSAMQAGTVVAGRAAQTMVGKIGTLLAPAARGLASQLCARAAQVAAPIVAVAQAHSRHRQHRILQQQQSLHAPPQQQQLEGNGGPCRQDLPGSNLGLQIEVKGGLLPLPPRSPRQGADAKQGVLSCSGLALPPVLQAAAVILPANGSSKGKGSPARGWFRGRRAASGAGPVLTGTKPTLLPTAALQAAVQPEGPASAPRRWLTRQQQPRQPSVLQLMCTGAQAATQPPRSRGIFRLACNPLAWIGAMGARRAAGGKTVVVLNPTSKTSPMRAHLARMWQWNAPTRSLPLAPNSPALCSSPGLLEQAMQPLDGPPTLDIGPFHSPTKTRMAFPRAFSFSNKPAAAPQLRRCISTTSQQAALPANGPAMPLLLHMPSLPPSPTAARRRPLFRRRLLQSKSMAVRQQSSTSAEVWLAAFVAHAQASSTSLIG